MAETVIYSFDHSTGRETFEPSGDDFVFDGVYRVVTNSKDLGIIFVPKDKVTDITPQPDTAELKEVTDLGLVAVIACRVGWKTNFSQLSDEKIAVLKDYGYDLIKKFKNNEGIEAAAQEYLEA
jgi:hypothetical protein